MPGGHTADGSNSMRVHANGFRAPTRTAVGTHAIISLPQPFTRAPTGPHGIPRAPPRAPVHGMSRGLLRTLMGCHAGLPGLTRGLSRAPEGGFHAGTHEIHAGPLVWTPKRAPSHWPPHHLPRGLPCALPRDVIRLPRGLHLVKARESLCGIS